MTKRIYQILIPAFCLFFIYASASENVKTKTLNFYDFSKHKIELNEEILISTPAEFRNHPELGIMPLQSPCKDCYEDISKRESNYRYFVKKGSGGSHFFKQQSLGDINYKDASGFWKEINYRLQEPNVQGEYFAPNQPNPVAIDLNKKFSSIKSEGYEILFNKSIEIYHQNKDGKLVALGTPNWSRYSAGDDGVRVVEFLPGIDMHMIVNEGRVKTNFILKSKQNLSEGWLVVKQHFEFNRELSFDGSLASKDEAGKIIGEIPVVDRSGRKIFNIGSNSIYDSNIESQMQIIAGAEFTSTNDFFVYVPVSWLNDKLVTYPVVIDPLVSATNNVVQVAITGSQYNSLCFTGGCSYNMPAITVPASCTVTDVTTTFTYEAKNSCTMQDGGVSVSYNACRSPNTGAYTNGLAFTGNAAIAASLFSDFSSCIPAAQCATYNMNFTMNFHRCNNDYTPGCTSNCIAAASAWVVTVEGHTVEIGSISPAQVMCTGGSAPLTASAAYGVGPYSYSWTPGPIAGQTVSVSPGGNQTYTCTITDACGSIASSTSQVNVAATTAPNVTITSNPASPLCEQSPVTFTATTTNGGSTPIFEWYVNGVLTATGPTFNTSTLFSGDVVSVKLTSSLPCASPASVTATYSGTVDFGFMFPTVTIAPSPASGCENAFIVFTATVFDCGINPTYQWQVNGVNVGTNSPTFSCANLINGDNVKCIVTPDNTVCALVPIFPADVTYTGFPSVLSSVAITQNPAGSLCTGQSVTFTATPTNGGAPTYQWYVNSTAVGGNSSTYTTTTLNNNDVVAVTMISSVACAQPKVSTSQVTVAVTGPSPASVSITQNPAGPFCFGIPVTFTATPTNGGATPTYQWYVNNVLVVGATNVSYTSSTLNNNDQVRVDFVSSSACAIPPNASSNTIIVTVTPSVTPSVTITPNPAGAICQGTSVTFTATSTNGGATPTYNWYVNGPPAAATGPTFTTSGLSNADVVTVELISSANCPVPAIVNALVIMTVLPPVVPSVTISYVPAGTICPGTNVTFTATPTNGGATPAYQWFVNGPPVAGTGPTFSSTTLNNSDVVSVTLTSSDQCANPTTATDQTIITIIPNVTPSVAISVNPGTSICQNTPVTFTATPTNGGASPTYQWQLNGFDILGATSSTYTTSTLVDNDLITVVMTSNEPCPLPAIVSNSVTITVLPTVVPSVTISVAPGLSICAGDNVTFTATPVNGGATPAYQWFINGVTQLSTTNTFSSTVLPNGAIVRVILSSSASCAVPVSDTDQVTMTVNSTTPSVTISKVPAGSVCEGAPITFTATPVSGGAAPTYQWFDGATAIAGATSATYTTSTLLNGASITVQMTSNAICPNPAQVTSNAIIVSITTNVTPSVTISANPAGVICVGNTVTFTATPVNGGPTPTYQWKKNGVNVGTNSSTFTTSALANGNTITVVMTTSLPCVTQPTATSNAIVIATAQPLQVQVSPPSSVCPGTEVTLDAVASGGLQPYFYSWDHGAGNDSSVTIVAGTTTTYKVTVTDICGSTPVSGTVKITVYPAALANFSYSPSNPSSLAPTVVFNDLSSNAVNWQWDLGDTTYSTDQNPTHTYSYPGNYLVKLAVQSPDGCLDSITYVIFVKDEIAFYVPNSFTPDGNGLNDEFLPMGYNVGTYTMTIFNRWGEVVFEGSDKKPWNGKYKDTTEPAPMGNYVYRIYLDDDKYNTPVVVGRVTLAR